MFLTTPHLHQTFPGVYELQEPLVYACGVVGAPPAITVPAGYGTRFEFLSPKLRRWVLPVGSATAAVILFAYLRRKTRLAPAILNEALRLSGVSWWKRLRFRLSLSGFGPL